MEASRADRSQPQPQRIIGSKQGYYKVSYTLADASSGVSKPPEWVPKHHVSNDLIMTWRHQRSDRLAFKEEFLSQKKGTIVSSVQEPTSSHLPQETVSDSRSDSQTLLRSSLSQVPATQPSESQQEHGVNTVPEASHSITGAENVQHTQPSVSDTVPSNDTQDQDVGMSQTQHPGPDQGTFSFVEASKNLQPATRPLEGVSINNALPLDREPPSQGPSSGSIDSVVFQGEILASQTPKRGGVFQVVRDAAHAALGVFNLSQSEPPSSQTEGLTEKDSTSNMAVDAPVIPNSSVEKTTVPASQPSVAFTTEVYSLPSIEPAPTQPMLESSSQDIPSNPEVSENHELSQVVNQSHTEPEERYKTSRSGRRIRRPVSTNEESSNETIEALNTRVKQQAEEVKFLKNLYEEASNSAMKATEQLGKAKDEIRLLKNQLSSGIETQRHLYMTEIAQWRQEAMRAQHQLQFLEQREQQTNDDIRRKAAEWDKHLEQEKRDNQLREKRWKEWEQRKQREGLVFHSSAESMVQDSLSNELAELAAEAEEASSSQKDIPASTRPRSSRRRVSGASQPQEAHVHEASSDAANLANAPATLATSSTLENRGRSKPVPAQESQTPDRISARSSQDDFVMTRSNPSTSTTATKRSYETSDHSMPMARSTLGPTAPDRPPMPCPPTHMPLPPSPWNPMTSYQYNSDDVSSAPRWKRRRREPGTNPTSTLTNRL